MEAHPACALFAVYSTVSRLEFDAGVCEMRAQHAGNMLGCSRR